MARLFLAFMLLTTLWWNSYVECNRVVSKEATAYAYTSGESDYKPASVNYYRSASPPQAYQYTSQIRYGANAETPLEPSQQNLYQNEYQQKRYDYGQQNGFNSRASLINSNRKYQTYPYNSYWQNAQPVVSEVRYNEYQPQIQTPEVSPESISVVKVQSHQRSSFSNANTPEIVSEYNAPIYQNKHSTGSYENFRPEASKISTEEFNHQYPVTNEFRREEANLAEPLIFTSQNEYKPINSQVIIEKEQPIVQHKTQVWQEPPIEHYQIQKQVIVEKEPSIIQEPIWSEPQNENYQIQRQSSVENEPPIIQRESHVYPTYNQFPQNTYPQGVPIENNPVWLEAQHTQPIHTPILTEKEPAVVPREPQIWNEPQNERSQFYNPAIVENQQTFVHREPQIWHEPLGPGNKFDTPNQQNPYPPMQQNVEPSLFPHELPPSYESPKQYPDKITPIVPEKEPVFPHELLPSYETRRQPLHIIPPIVSEKEPVFSPPVNIEKEPPIYPHEPPVIYEPQKEQFPIIPLAPIPEREPVAPPPLVSVPKKEPTPPPAPAPLPAPQPTIAQSSAVADSQSYVVTKKIPAPPHKHDIKHKPLPPKLHIQYLPHLHVQQLHNTLITKGNGITKCGPNQIFKECGPACADTCETLNYPGRICSQQCVPGCFCAEGFVKNGDGKCIAVAECCKAEPGDTCPTDKNATMVACPSACPKTCANLNAPDAACAQVCLSQGCECDDDYVLDTLTGSCVNPSDCSSKLISRCGKKEVFTLCAACQLSCENIHIPNFVCNETCPLPGCVCKPGYVRNHDDNCIPAPKCPKNPNEVETPTICLGPNEEFSRCGSPKVKTCDNYKIKTRTFPICAQGCFCKRGYVRNAFGKCIRKRDCRKNPLAVDDDDCDNNDDINKSKPDKEKPKENKDKYNNENDDVIEQPPKEKEQSEEKNKKEDVPKKPKTHHKHSKHHHKSKKVHKVPLKDDDEDNGDKSVPYPDDAYYTKENEPNSKEEGDENKKIKKKPYDDDESHKDGNYPDNSDIFDDSDVTKKPNKKSKPDNNDDCDTDGDYSKKPNANNQSNPDNEDDCDTNGDYPKGINDEVIHKKHKLNKPRKHQPIVIEDNQDGDDSKPDYDNVDDSSKKTNEKKNKEKPSQDDEDDYLENDSTAVVSKTYKTTDDNEEDTPPTISKYGKKYYPKHPSKPEKETNEKVESNERDNEGVAKRGNDRKKPKYPSKHTKFNKPQSNEDDSKKQIKESKEPRKHSAVGKKAKKLPKSTVEITAELKSGLEKTEHSKMKLEIQDHNDSTLTLNISLAINESPDGTKHNFEKNKTMVVLVVIPIDELLTHGKVKKGDKNIKGTSTFNFKLNPKNQENAQAVGTKTDDDDCEDELEKNKQDKPGSTEYVKKSSKEDGETKPKSNKKNKKQKIQHRKRNITREQEKPNKDEEEEETYEEKSNGSSETKERKHHKKTKGPSYREIYSDETEYNNDNDNESPNDDESQNQYKVSSKSDESHRKEDNYEDETDENIKKKIQTKTETKTKGGDKSEKSNKKEQTEKRKVSHKKGTKKSDDMDKASIKFHISSHKKDNEGDENNKGKNTHKKTHKKKNKGKHHKNKGDDHKNDDEDVDE